MGVRISASSARYPYSYVPAVVTHGYGNVNHATPTPYVYDRVSADVAYGEQAASAARYPYSYVPAVVTHGYRNVHHVTPTPYVYDRVSADVPYGEQAARHPYSYVPSTHSYSNVAYGHRAREGYSRPAAPVYAPAV